MKQTFHLLAAIALLGATAEAAIQTINPTDDAHVRQDQPTNTYNLTTLPMREWLSGQRRAFMQFTINAPRAMQTVTLRVYSNTVTAGQGYTLTPKSTGTGWSESTLTWNNMPAVGAAVATGAIVGEAGDEAGRYVEFDVSNHVTVNGIYSFELASTGNGSSSRFLQSKENTNKPELVIVYSDVNSPPTFSEDPTSKAGTRATIAYSGTLANDATDPDAGDTLAFSKVGSSHSGPGSDWLSVAFNGALTGTATAANLGAHTWTVQVDDGNGGSDTATLSIHVVAATTPNILYILADDLGYADVGANGWADLEFTTPNIDTIFTDGARFQAALVSNSVCAPSRAGLLTGRMGSRFGFESNLPSESGDTGSTIGLDPSQDTIADVVKTVGYRTFAIGKWHLGENDPLFHPNARGFDEFYGMRGGSRTYCQMASYDSHDSVLDGTTWVQEPSDIYMTDFLTDQALTYITDQNTNQPGQPWLMYMSYTAPHGPMEAKEADLLRVPLDDHFGGDYTKDIPTKTLGTNGVCTSSATRDNDALRQIYGAMVVSMDDNIGRLLDKLDQLNIANNTMVVFHSDNGGPGIGKNWSINDPLRGTKGSLWEGGIRVPFAISWPGTITSGQVFGYDCPISSLDLMPTFADISGADQVHDVRTDGINLMPLLTGTVTTTSPRSLFWRRGTKQQIAVRSGDYKYYKNRNTGDEVLYDHSSSAAEGTNLKNTHPTILAQLQSEYADFEATIPDPKWNADGYLLAITTYDLDTASTGTAYSLTPTHSSVAGETVTWSIPSGKPTWLSINSTTGELSGTPSKADAYRSTIELQIDDGTNTSTYTVPLLIPDTNNISLADWKDVHGITGAANTDDTDGDTVNNILEYALGGIPTIKDQVEMPDLAVDAGTVTFEHLRRKSQTLNYDVKVSDELVDWDPASITDTSTFDRSDGFEEVTVTLDIDPSVTLKQFVHLNVSE